MMQYVVANQLVTSGVLTFTDDRIEQITDGTIDMMHQFSLLVRSIKRKGERAFPYVAVPEFSKTGRRHIHFMLPAEFPYDMVEEKWYRNGHALHKIIADTGELSRVGFYLGKHFDKPESERPTKRRVIMAEGFKPKPINYGFLTRAQALEIATRHADEAGTVIKEFDSKKPWLRGGFKWFEHSEFEEGVLPPWAS